MNDLIDYVKNARFTLRNAEREARPGDKHLVLSASEAENIADTLLAVESALLATPSVSPSPVVGEAAAPDLLDDREGFYYRTIEAKGDVNVCINIARSMVNQNDQKHEPYLSMMQALVQAWDKEHAAFKAATEKLAQREQQVREALIGLLADPLPFTTSKLEQEQGVVLGQNLERTTHNKNILAAAASLGIDLNTPTPTN